MKIHLITGSFTPDINPRSFRSFELARQLASCGHQVTVSNLSYTEGYDYKKLEEEFGIIIQLIPIYKHTKPSKKESVAQSKFKRIVKNLLKYYIGGKLFVYERRISRKLAISKDTDLVISISVPFVTHLTTAKFRRRHAKDFLHTTFVADSGDPFSTCQQFELAPYFKLLERRVLKKFDYLSIPTSQAIDAYKSLVEPEKIKIIPQGFNLEIRNTLPPVHRNLIPHFAYAGVFYEGIINPKFLFDYLDKLDIKFEFYLFIREESQFLDSLLRTYSSDFKDKIIVHYGLKRDELLLKLREMDFLINIANTTTVQVPSKIIDYAIVERPFLSFNEETFSSAVLDEFLKGDYNHSDKIPNLDDYDIKNVAKQFLSLVSK